MTDFTREEAFAAIDAFVGADRDRKLAVVDAHRHILLTDAAIGILRGEAASHPEGSDARQYFAWHADILKLCRRQGVSVGFLAITRGVGDQPPPADAAALWALIAWIRAAVSDPRVPPDDLASAALRALVVFQRDADPGLWAALVVALGNALAALGEREAGTERLEDAVAAFRDALEVYTREDVPSDWAMTMHGLGNALLRLGAREAGTERLEAAVAAHRDALEVYTREDAPSDWAMTKNNLGNALAALGEREAGTERLEAAVTAYRDALEVRTRAAAPPDWAMTMNNLGNALAALGEREAGTERLEEAVAAFRDALEEYTREAAPSDWAMTMNGLGNALLSLGEREAGTARLEEAVTAYRDALEVRTREDAPTQWATTKNNLGTALATLGQREAGTERLEAAVAAHRDALEVYTREAAPSDWAATKNNLGSALAPLGELEAGTERLEEAVTAYRDALEVRTREAAPTQWAMTQNNLGAALFRLGEREAGTERLEEAVAAFRDALEVYTREAAPSQWAATKNNLGNALVSLGEREAGAARLEAAVTAFRDALEVRTREDAPVQFIGSFRGLARALLLARDWAGVVAQLEPEIGALLETALFARTEAERRRVIEDADGLGDLLAYAHLQLGHPDKALSAALAGRGIELEIAALIRRLDRGEGQLADAARAYRTAAISLDALERERSDALMAGATPPDPAPLAAAKEALNHAYTAYSDTIRGARTGAHGGAPTPEDLARHLPERGALVVPIITPAGGAVMIVPFGAPNVTMQHVVMIDALTTDSVRQIDTDWFNAFISYRGAIGARETLADRTGAADPFAAWGAAIETAQAQLHDLIMAPLARGLAALGLPAADAFAPEAPEIVMMAPGRLVNLPLATAGHCDTDGQWTTFLDLYALTFSPSAEVFQSAAQRRQRWSRRPHLLGITAPTPDLWHWADTNPAASLFDEGACTDLCHAEATPQRVKANLASAAATHVVFYCHGIMNWASPHESGLLLADDAVDTPSIASEDAPLPSGALLSMADIRQLDAATMNAIRLVVLSACDTAVVARGIAPVNEYPSLSGAMLIAGAGSVIGSNWPIAARETLHVTRRVVELELAGLSPAQAVRRTCLELRDGRLPIHFKGHAPAPIFDTTADQEHAPALGAQPVRRARHRVTHADPSLSGQDYENQSLGKRTNPAYWAAFAAWG